MERRLKVLAIEPYFGLSHQMFLDGYCRYTRHDVEVWQLPARKWKWRMRGSAYSFADRARTIADGERPDVIIASDFLNLADFRALSPRSLRGVPALLYFHENQIGYPLSEKAPIDFHYGWINLSSALAAESVLFNSSFHREHFLLEVERILHLMPDYVPSDLIPRLRSKSGVFPVGLDFAPHEELLAKRAPWNPEAPLILWNHRWEYDKDPDRFADALMDLERNGVPFRVAICGESFGKIPDAFVRLQSHLSHRIEHMGFLASADEYRRLVARCDIVVSTARHEFFGVSVVEGVFLGCLPVLPNALSYPEIVPPHLHPLFLYRDSTSLPEFLARFIAEPPLKFATELQRSMERFHWRALAPILDGHLEKLVEAPAGGG